MLLALYRSILAPARYRCSAHLPRTVNATDIRRDSSSRASKRGRGQRNPMPSMSKVYAVRVGREGAKIYDTWAECDRNVTRFSGAKYKSFTSRSEAEQWIQPWLTNEASALDLEQTARELAPNAGHESPISLSEEQQSVLQMVRTGKNVFFTGAAGTGKSVLLREIISTLRASGAENIAITASTGIASVNIGGTTLHSWAGIHLGNGRAEYLADKIQSGKCGKVYERWINVQTLIIDEISMIDGSLFEKLEYIARSVRNSTKPFGGIQLVLSGDFSQLPPVPEQCNGVAVPVKFAFETDAWTRCIDRPVQLTRVFRQTERDFVEMLNAMRFGNMTPSTIEKFRSLSRPVKYNDGIEPTQLFPTRNEVDSANKSRLHQLPGSTHTFVAMDRPGYDDKNERISREQMERLLSRLVVQSSVDLKVGAQVMLVKNLAQGRLVNGSVGKIVAFRTHLEDDAEASAESDANQPCASPLLERRWPLVEFTSETKILITPEEFTINSAHGKVEASRTQVPLILAWAMSVHKSQGQTLDRVKVDLARTFEKGQAYVALSRAKSMERAQVLNFNPDKVMVHPRVLRWYKTMTLNTQNID